MRNFLLIGGVLFLTACLPLHTEQYISNNHRLLELFEADQDARSSNDIDWKMVSTQDKARREEVLSIIAKDGLHTSEDYYHAAMVFQHGEKADEIRTAYSLAWLASVMDPNNDATRWLSAAAWDRIMMRENMPQWYGTQFYKASPDAPWELYKIDESVVTDEERARMKVPPLETARERARKMNE